MVFNGIEVRLLMALVQWSRGFLFSRGAGLSVRVCGYNISWVLSNSDLRERIELRGCCQYG